MRKHLSYSLDFVLTSIGFDFNHFWNINEKEVAEFVEHTGNYLLRTWEGRLWTTKRSRLMKRAGKSVRQLKTLAEKMCGQEMTEKHHLVASFESPIGKERIWIGGLQFVSGFRAGCILEGTDSKEPSFEFDLNSLRLYTNVALAEFIEQVERFVRKHQTRKQSGA